MGKVVVLNGLPLGAVNGSKVIANEITLDQAKKLLKSSETVSAIGHSDTAVILSNLLETKLECNRITVTLDSSAQYLVCAYVGPRLPEGTTVLPSGAKFRFFVVAVE